MITKVISLSPTMLNRLNFKHDLMDFVDDYKLSREDTAPTIRRFLNGDTAARDELILGYMWLAKDLVCRYRSHFPETRRFTGELVSEGLGAIADFVDRMDDFEEQGRFFNQLQSFINERLRIFINDNRSTFAASYSTNRRRGAENRELEYTYAGRIKDEVLGQLDENLEYVDILDSIESLQSVEKEEMHNLIAQFLKQDHGLDESELTQDERDAMERLSEIGIRL